MSQQMSQHPFLISPDSAHLAENGTFQTAYDSSPQFDLIFIHLRVIDALPESPHLTNLSVTRTSEFSVRRASNLRFRGNTATCQKMALWYCRPRADLVFVLKTGGPGPISIGSRRSKIGG